jgi:hypothetical protein
MQSDDTKRKLLDMWFTKVYGHVAEIEDTVKNIDENFKDYDALADQIELQFNNLRIIRKVLMNEALLQGYNHNLLT